MPKSTLLVRHRQSVWGALLEYSPQIIPSIFRPVGQISIESPDEYTIEERLSIHSWFTAAERHHWNEKFWVLFDNEQDSLEQGSIQADDRAGIMVLRSFAGSEEPVYRVALLDEGQNIIEELSITSVERRLMTALE
ncbi:MAG: hypothetical protein AAF702_51925 [Chloroflexota bacterium]